MNRRRIPRGLLPAAILVVALIGTILMIALRPEPPKRPTVTPQPVVVTHTVLESAPRIVVRGFGTVHSRERISLVPQVSGVVVAKSPGLEPGGVFAAGEELLGIDEADYRLTVEIAAAAVAAREYELARAEQEADLARSEWEQVVAGGTVAEPTALVLHEPQLKLARANLASARAQLAQAGLNLERCTLLAPFAGRVVDAAVDVGQYVRSGNEVAEIYALDAAEVVVPLSDADLAFLGLPDADGAGGATAEITADFAGGLHVWTGRVVRAGGEVDPQTRMIDVVLAVDDPWRRTDDRPALVEGMFVEARIRGRDLPGAVSVPRSALRPDDRVWVVDSEDRLRFRDVDVARVDHETAVLIGGLAPGDVVVVSQLAVVSDGMAVRVQGRAGSGPAAASSPPGGERP